LRFSTVRCEELAGRFHSAITLCPRSTEGHYGIYFGAHQIAEIELTSQKSVGSVSEQVLVISPG